MRRSRLLAPLAALFAFPAHAQDRLVAPFVPTVEEDVELMLEIAQVGPGDYLIDLGSGDGRIVIAAARRGALGHGVELQPHLVEQAAANARAAGVAERVAFQHGDIFAADIRAASVVTLYLFPEANLSLRPKLLAELEPGTRVVSNSFHMGDWEPDEHDPRARSSGGILLWIVPARIAGDWDLEIEGDGARYALTARQRYQEVQLAGRGRVLPFAIDPAVLRGERIEFAAESGTERYAFSGRVEGDAMGGLVLIERGGDTRTAGWQARRTAQVTTSP